VALPVFKIGLSMQVDRWVRLPPSPAIFVLLGFGLRVGVQVDSARFQTAPTDVVSFVFWGCRFTLLACG